MSKPKFYITTAIAYASRKPHVGNVYDIVLADMIARYKRMMGYDVRFLTGSDEHGQKIEEYAKEAGKTPQEYVDNTAATIKAVWDSMNVTYDRFIRTTDPDHVAVIQKIFKKLYDKGDIYKSSYEGKYCVPCESFYTPSQLVDGKCPDCGRDCVDAKEEAYFLKLSKYQDQLLQYYNDNPDFFAPVSRRNEMINNFLKPGLNDLCVSRSSFKWGIPVDFDPDHVAYVWIDALSNYITGLGYDVDEPVNIVVNDDGYVDVEMPVEDIAPYKHIVEVCVPLIDGSRMTVTDYASAGKLWTEESKMAAWMLTVLMDIYFHRIYTHQIYLTRI